MGDLGCETDGERERLFPGDSELAARMRALDWASTDLGAPEKWPATWRMAVSLCLTSRIPIVLYLGPQFTVLYNDPYISFLGETKHPRYLGRPGQECWREIWPTIGPMLESVYETEKATWSEDVLMFFARRLPLEEVYVRFTFGPILAAEGRSVDGIFCPCTETTEQVIAARRLETLRKLGVQAAEARTVVSACEEAAAVLADNPQDIPFAAIYLVNETGRQAELQAWAGFPDGDPPVPLSVSADDTALAWPLADVLRTRLVMEVQDLQAAGLRLPGGPWRDEPISQALVLPVFGPVHDALSALLIIGVSTRRVLDDAYRTFFDLIVGHIGTSISDAQAYEAERKRAEALAELDRAKTAFFSNVSHEFRTPLTLMLGPLEDALREPRQDNDRERLELIHRNGLRLLKLVNTLLDFSRIEAGRANATYEPTDLAAFTTDLTSVFRSAIERVGLRFIVNCAPTSEPAYVDRDMWEKIVLNLLSNAFKYTFEGEIEVSLQVTDGCYRLLVRDTGTGIPEHDVPHVFERFHRVEGAQGRTHEGTGIGLALVSELVKLHGGRVMLQSTIGKGSAFTVAVPTGSAHLPADRIRASATPTPTALGSAPYIEEALRWLPSGTQTRPVSDGLATVSPSEQSRVRTPGGDSPQIIIADDNADMRDYIGRLLSQEYQVETVGDGEAALQAIRRCRPALVLTDIMMPHLDGFNLLKALRNDPDTRTLPVILLSARAGEEARVEGLEAGADDYLVKPFSAQELLARVRTHVELARVRQQSESEIRRLNTELTNRIREYEKLLQKLKGSQAALVEKVKDLETFHDVAVGRELRMMHLEQEIARLTRLLGAA